MGGSGHGELLCCCVCILFLVGNEVSRVSHIPEPVSSNTFCCHILLLADWQTELTRNLFISLFPNSPGAGCGVSEVVVFCLALIAGTGCSLTSKVLLEMESEGMDGVTKKFQKPLFQTLGMFVGMCAALIMHFLVILFRIPFPGYKHPAPKKGYNSISSDDDDDEPESAGERVKRAYLGENRNQN